MGLDIWFTKKTTIELKFFRKVNFLITFFEKYGLDVDNQTPLRINEDMVKDLINACNTVLENHEEAPKVLPTTPGFFFGSLAYDDAYFEDVKEVKQTWEDILLPEMENAANDEEFTFEIWYQRNLNKLFKCI